MLICHCYHTTCTFPFIACLISGPSGRLFICHRIFEAIAFYVYMGFYLGPFGPSAIFTVPRKLQLAMLNVTAVVIPCYSEGLCMADRITNSKLTTEDTKIESWDSRPRAEFVYHDVRCHEWKHRTDSLLTRSRHFFVALVPSQFHRCMCLPCSTLMSCSGYSMCRPTVRVCTRHPILSATALNASIYTSSCTFHEPHVSTVMRATRATKGLCINYQSMTRALFMHLGESSKPEGIP